MPQAAQWSGTPSIRGSTESVRMAMLTFSLIGLQFTWGVEMTYGTPYLLSLGLTKAHTSAVWLAGPLSGLIMQPLVGAIADESRSKWGRRRPFMVGGSFVVMGCLLCLGWAKEIVTHIGVAEESKASWAIIVAIASIYAVDFSINIVQACCRSLIVDTLPIPKQQLGSAWASRMSAIGHLIGYGIGTLDLRSIWGDVLGDTQFKQLCAIAGLALIFACGATSYCVKERVLISSKDSNHKPTPLSMVLKIFRMTTTLPPRIRAICHVQFWTWIGWFPFLFYSPTWVGETYFHSTPASDLPQSPSERLGALGRIGSLSLVIFSLVTFLASIVLPFVVRSPDGSSKTPSSDRFTPRPAKFLEPVIKKLDGLGRFKPDLLTAWFYAHFIFATTMLSAPLVGSLHAATLVVAFSGLPWALAGWAPYALMGVEINRLSLDPTASSRHFRAHSLSAPFAPNQYRPSLDLERARDESESPTLLRLKHAGDAEDSDSDDDMYEAGGLLSAGMGRRGNKDGLASTGETAGVYLGILNLFTTLPQFVGTFISMIVFSIFEQAPTETAEGKEDGADTLKPQGVNPIAVCLFIGGVCSLVAAWATRRLRRISRG